jgi:hypothetical protein
VTDDRVLSRASHPLPEELPTDTDPRVQASALLAESDLRTAQATTGAEDDTERRTSAQAADAKEGETT